MINSSYKISDKELLEVLKNIFFERGIPSLHENGFTRSPFSTAWYGKNNLGDYTFELCRVSSGSFLEIIITHISKGDKFIKIFLNVFRLIPDLSSINELTGVDGLHYHLPPNSLSKMQLKVDSFKGIPLLNYDFLFKGHKLKSFDSASGLEKRANQLGDIIEKDLRNINYFLGVWHQLHKPNFTDWEGNTIK